MSKAGATRQNIADAAIPTFGDYLEEWLETYSGRTGRGITDSTRNDYRRSLERHALPHWSEIPIDQISARDIRRLVRRLEDGGQAPSSVRKDIAAVKTL